MRPAVFVGSSKEGRQIAEAIQVLLDETHEVEVWDQGAFDLSDTSIESLVAAVRRFDFAIIVVTPDDLAIKRGTSKAAPRDNVIFEVGLFIGGLGRERTFIVSERNQALELPSDLAGVTFATFQPHSSGNLLPALGAPCARLRAAMRSLGPRQTEALSQAAQTLESAGTDLERMVALMARSRRLEFEIILEQFNSGLPDERLTEIRNDLVALEGRTEMPEPFVRTHAHWNMNVMLEALEAAPDGTTVSILQTWFPDREVFFPRLSQLLTRSSKSFKLRILLLDPASTGQEDTGLVAARVMTRADLNRAEALDEIGASIASLGRMRRAVEGSWQEQDRRNPVLDIRLKLYRFMPFGPLYRFSHRDLDTGDRWGRMYAGFYVNYGSGFSGPMMELADRPSNSVWLPLSEQFDHGWEHDTSVEVAVE